MSTLSLAHTLRQQLLHSKSPIQPTRRWLAEAVGLIPDPSNSKETVGPVDWRKRKVSVREDHGLWGFFRRRESENEEELKGEAKYMICETPSMETSGTYLSRIIQTICFFLFKLWCLCRTWMESRGIALEELQGHTYTVVCSPPRT